MVKLSALTALNTHYNTYVFLFNSFKGFTVVSENDEFQQIVMNGGGLGLGGPADGRGKMKSIYDMGASYFQQCEQLIN